MALLEGFLSGLGQSARDAAHSMLDTHLKQLQGLSDVYSHIAQNPNFSPDVQKEALNRVAQLQGSVNNFGMPDMGAVKKLSNFKDLFQVNQIAQQPTAPAASTQSGGMPYTYQDEYAGGMRRPDIVAQNVSGMERNKAFAQSQGHFDALKASGYGGMMAGSGGGNAMSQALQPYLSQKMINPRAWVPPIVHGPASWVDSAGRPHQGEEYHEIMGQKFDAKGDPLDWDPNKPFVPGALQIVPGEQGEAYLISKGGGMAPVDTGLRHTPVPMQHTETENPATLTRTTTTTPMVGGGGGGQAQIPGVPPAPQQTQQPGAAVPPPTNLGAPAPAEIQESFRKEEPKLIANRAAMKQLVVLDDMLNDPKHRALVGAALGRAAEFANKVGSGGLVNWLHGLAYGNEPQTPEQQKAWIDNATAAMQSAAADKSTPAEVSAEMITLMRAINGLEVGAMTSGNGISRLYMMMRDAMLNPGQSADLLRGHIKGLADVFAGLNSSIMQARGQGWKNVPPAEQDIYKHFLGDRTATYFPDYVSDDNQKILNATNQHPNLGGNKPHLAKGKMLYPYPGGGWDVIPPPPENTSPKR